MMRMDRSLVFGMLDNACLKYKIDVIYQHQNPLESMFSHTLFVVSFCGK